MRRSFEEKLRTFSQAQNQFEQEKKAALEELKAQHRQEIQELLRSHQSQNANYSKDQEKLGQLHKAEVTQSLLKWSSLLEAKATNVNLCREKVGQTLLLTVCYTRRWFKPATSTPKHRSDFIKSTPSIKLTGLQSPHTNHSDSLMFFWSLQTWAVLLMSCWLATGGFSDGAGGGAQARQKETGGGIRGQTQQGNSAAAAVAPQISIPAETLVCWSSSSDTMRVWQTSTDEHLHEQICINQ